MTATEKTANAVKFIKKDLDLEYLRDEVVRLRETRCNVIERRESYEDRDF